MGMFNEIDIEVMEMVRDGATREQVEAKFPFISQDELDTYFGGDYDSEVYPEERDYQYDDSMDGDTASALASAGWGTDEDYGCFGGDDY